MNNFFKIRKKIKKKFLNREKIFGGWVSFEVAAISEIFSAINFDFIAIDMEHTTISNQVAKNIILACNSHNKPCFPRPVSFSNEILKPVLDSGADGIIATTVNSSKDVKEFISNVKYPNIGIRSYGINRAQTYGLLETEYFKLWNQYSTCIIQIESKQGVDNLEDILNHNEIDGIMVGPYDLAGSLGVPGKTDHKLVKSACRYIVETCKKFKVSCGTQVSIFNKKKIKDIFNFGYNFVILGSDLFILKNWALDTNKLINNFKKKSEK